MEMPFLTAALIVRDEADSIGPCLSSIEPHVDAVVVVDTGSTDATAELAEATGAEVLSAQWSDDFAAARNVSLDAVRGPWALVIDADERLEVPADIDLRAWLRTRDGLGHGWVTVVSEQPAGGSETGWAVRLLRADRGLRYQYPVHEQLDLAGTRGEDAPCRLRHLGHLDTAAATARQARYLARLDRMPATDAHRLLFTVRTLVSLGRWDDVEEVALRWEMLGFEAGPQDAQVHFYAAVAASNRNAPADVARWVDRGLRRHPESPDLHLVTMALSASRFLSALDAIADPEHALHHYGGNTERFRGAAGAFLAALASGRSGA